MIDEELILFRLAERMPLVRWTRSDDPDPDTRKFITVSRRIRLFSDVAANQQPACFQTEWATDEQQVTGMPYKSTLMAAWTIFQCIGKDQKALGTVENNLIIGGCRKVLAPQPDDPGFLDNRNTLGGLVHHCFISGRIFKDPGDIDDQGMIVIPIKVLVP
jgi:hypothetical protein